MAGKSRLSSKTSKAAAAYRGPGTQQRMFGRYHKHYAVADCRWHHWTKWKHSLSKVNCFSCNIPGNSFTLLTFAALILTFTLWWTIICANMSIKNDVKNNSKALPAGRNYPWWFSHITYHYHLLLYYTVHNQLKFLICREAPRCTCDVI